MTGVSITWEAAYAASYEVLTATSAPDDAASWTVAATQPTGAGGTEGIVFDAPVQARYVRLAMLERVAFTWDPAGPHYYGYSVFTFAVNGTLAVPTVGFLSAARAQSEPEPTPSPRSDSAIRRPRTRPCAS